MSQHTNTFRIPARIALSILFSLLTGSKRDIRSDSLELASYLKPPAEIHGEKSARKTKGSVLIINHYSREGFPVWLTAALVSAAVEYPIHWVMTSAWIYESYWKSLLITPLSRLVFSRLANIYNLTAMPPMPPRQYELLERAAAVRKLLIFARTNPEVNIGFAPEGRDPPEERRNNQTKEQHAPPDSRTALTDPPPGVGKLLAKFSAGGKKIIPVGVYEKSNRIFVHFGNPVEPVPAGLTRDQIDQYYLQTTMKELAACLPNSMRGKYL